MKITSNRLLTEINRMGGGEIAEFMLLRRLDISHGQFCQLRRELVADGRLEVTHPNRKAKYVVLEPEEPEVAEVADSAEDAGKADFFALRLNVFHLMKQIRTTVIRHEVRKG